MKAPTASARRISLIPCLLLPLLACDLQAATVTLPAIVITPGTNGSISGIDTNQGIGSFTTTDTNVVVTSGDVVEVTLLPQPGNRFRLLTSSGGATRQLALIFGPQITLGTEQLGTDSSITFQNVTGGVAPTPGPYLGSKNSISGPAFDQIFFVTSPSPWSNPDTVEFDSVTLRTTVSNPSPISVSTLPSVLVFSAAGSDGLSQVPVPEPTSSMLVGFAAGLCAMRRRR